MESAVPFAVVPSQVPESLSSSANQSAAGNSKRSCVVSAATSVG